MAQDDRSAEHADPKFAVEPVGTSEIGEFRREQVAIGGDRAAQLVDVVEQAEDFAAVGAGAAQDDRERETRALDAILHFVRIAQADRLGHAQSGRPGKPLRHLVAARLEDVGRAIDDPAGEIAQQPVEVREDPGIAIRVADLVDQAAVRGHRRQRRTLEDVGGQLHQRHGRVAEQPVQVIIAEQPIPPSAWRAGSPSDP